MAKRKYKAQYGLDPIEGRLQGRKVEPSMPTGKIPMGPAALTQHVERTPNPNYMQLPWYWQAFNSAAYLTTGIANGLQEARNRRQEDREYLEALQTPGYENFNEDGYGDVPMYYQMGGAPMQPILAEAGEVYQDMQGSLNKISDSADRHEDPSGGVVVPDAYRVLEDTSTSRKDPMSKALMLSPKMSESLIGLKAKGNLSHAKAMEKASEQINKDVNRFQSKIKKNVKDLARRPHDKYAQNSMNFNLKNLSNLTTEGEVFDNLFAHQESVKGMAGHVQDLPKAQFGFLNLLMQNSDAAYRKAALQSRARASKNMRDAARVPNPEAPAAPAAASSNWGLWPGDQGTEFFSRHNTTNAAQHSYDLDTIAMALGYDGPKDNKAFQEWVYNSSPRAKAILDRTHNTFGNPTGGMFDGKFGIRWQQALQEIMRQTPVTSPGPNFDLMPKGSGVGATPLPEAPVAPETPAGSRFNFKQQPKSTFNEPLHWYDLAGPLQGILEGRDLVRYNPIELNKIRLHQQNPLPAMQQGQRDFNTALGQLSNDGQGYANTANLFARKYAMNNQVLGQYEGINNQIKNQETMYNAQVDDRQSAADQQARELFERKVLMGREALRQQHLTSWNDMYTRLAQNRAFNRNANMIMKLFPAFDQNLDYNGYQAQFRAPLSLPNTGLLPFAPNPTTETKTKKYSTK